MVESCERIYIVRCVESGLWVVERVGDAGEGLAEARNTLVQRVRACREYARAEISRRRYARGCFEKQRAASRVRVEGSGEEENEGDRGSRGKSFVLCA